MNLFTKNKIVFTVVVAITTMALGFVYLESLKNAKKNSENQSGARIIIDPAIYDFGAIRYQDIARHEFEIKNMGSEDLEILRISTSCGCTKAEMAEGTKTVSPGKSAKMIVTMDPSSHKSYYDIGKIKRVVYVRTNDKNDAETKIELEANVIKPENSVTFEIKGESGKLSPSLMKAEENSFIELKFSSKDSKYIFKLDAWGVSVNFEAGEKKSVVFYADKKGEFEFYDGNGGGSRGVLKIN